MQLSDYKTSVKLVAAFLMVALIGAVQAILAGLKVRVTQTLPAPKGPLKRPSLSFASRRLPRSSAPAPGCGPGPTAP